MLGSGTHGGVRVVWGGEEGRLVRLAEVEEVRAPLGFKGESQMRSLRGLTNVARHGCNLQLGMEWHVAEETGCCAAALCKLWYSQKSYLWLRHIRQD